MVVTHRSTPLSPNREGVAWNKTMLGYMAKRLASDFAWAIRPADEDDMATLDRYL